MPSTPNCAAASISGSANSAALAAAEALSAVGLHRHDVANEQRASDAIVHSQRRLQCTRRVAGAREAASDVIERVLALLAAFQFLRFASMPARASGPRLARSPLSACRRPSCASVTARRSGSRGSASTLAIAVCEHLLRAICIAGDRARRREPPLHRGAMQIVVDFLQRLDRAARRRPCPRAPAQCVRRPARRSARRTRPAIASARSLRPACNFGDGDVAGRECLVERIVDVAQHVARVCQVAARRRNRDELPQDLALRFAFADRTQPSAEPLRRCRRAARPWRSARARRPAAASPRSGSPSRARRRRSSAAICASTMSFNTQSRNAGSRICSTAASAW